MASGHRNRGGNTEMPKQYWVYILTDQRNTVLYTGVTGELQRRVYQHREKLPPGFMSRYNVSKLVFYEPKSGSCTTETRRTRRKTMHWIKPAAHPSGNNGRIPSY
jgi:putative endonuclease